MSRNKESIAYRGIFRNIIYKQLFWFRMSSGFANIINESSAIFYYLFLENLLFIILRAVPRYYHNPAEQNVLNATMYGQNLRGKIHYSIFWKEYYTCI
jgi:hypothetical protein